MRWCGNRIGATLAVLAVVVGSHGARAVETIDFSGSEQTLQNVRSARVVAILQTLTDAKATQKDPRVSSWLDELGTVYASLTGAPIWTTGSGYTPRALEVIGEFERADDWGLSPKAFKVDTSSYGYLDHSTLAKMEIDLSLALIKYAWHARGGRIEPTDLSLWLDRRIQPIDAVSIIKSVALSDNAPSAMHQLHPQHAEFERLRQAYLALRGPAAAKKQKPRPEDVVVPARGPKIRPGGRHPHVAIIRRRLNVPAGEREDPSIYTPDVVEAVYAYMRTQGWKRKRTIDNRVRRALNKPKGKRKKKRLTTASKKTLLLVNMEKWRWMPDDLGAFYIWNNLPAFKTQVVKNGEVIHEERIIIGKTHTQTPVFSDEMTHIVFKPEWGVPSSIKVQSLLPRLASGDYGVLARRGMRIKYDDGTVLNPGRLNWSRTDIRSVPIVMGPGSSNPLGRVKFVFPNEHAVYMHDTPKKYLFKNAKRTFSHGCIRVRHPVRLAEVLLDEVAGWDPSLVASNLSRRATSNNKIPLPQAIPVHNVYFTVTVDPETGRLIQLADIYGHDKRIRDALNGKSPELIARNDPARAQKRRTEQLAKSARQIYARAQAEQDPLGFSDSAFGSGPLWGTWGKPKQPVKTATKKKWYKRRGPKRKAWQVNPYQGGY